MNLKTAIKHRAKITGGRARYYLIAGSYDKSGGLPTIAIQLLRADISPVPPKDEVVKVWVREGYISHNFDKIQSTTHHKKLTEEALEDILSGMWRYGTFNASARNKGYGIDNPRKRLEEKGVWKYVVEYQNWIKSSEI